jgi:hypothetical protein
MPKRRKLRSTLNRADIAVIAAADSAVLAIVTGWVQFLETENMLVAAEFEMFLDGLADEFEEQEVNPVLLFFFRAHIEAMKAPPDVPEGEA